MGTVDSSKGRRLISDGIRQAPSGKSATRSQADFKGGFQVGRGSGLTSDFNSQFENTSLSHDFVGGTEEERERAYAEQESLRESLTAETKAYFLETYGIDLNAELRPGGGTIVNLDRGNASESGHYNWITNKIGLNLDHAERNSQFYQATLLHATEHWANDRAKFFGSLRPELGRGIVERVASEFASVGRKPPGWLHGPYGYASEIVQFGRIIWH